MCYRCSFRGVEVMYTTTERVLKMDKWIKIDNMDNGN